LEHEKVGRSKTSLVTPSSCIDTEDSHSYPKRGSELLVQWRKELSYVRCSNYGNSKTVRLERHPFYNTYFNVCH